MNYENKKVRGRFFNGLVWLGILGSLISCLGQFGKHHFFFDLLSHFRIQYVVLISLLTILILVRRRHRLLWISLACLSLHLYEISGTWSSVELDGLPEESRIVRVMSSNLLQSNDRYGEQISYLRSIDPDIVVFQEYTNAWDGILKLELNEYPFRLTDPIDTPYGIAIYSKHDLVKAEKVLAEVERENSLDVSIEIGGQRVRVFGTHPPPPMSPHLYELRNKSLRRLAQTVKEHRGPMLVVGDLNISPWSAHFKDFVREAGLVDSRIIYQIMPTYPSFFFPLQIPIDYILFNQKLKLVQAGKSSQMGSDHLTIWADIAIRK